MKKFTFVFVLLAFFSVNVAQTHAATFKDLFSKLSNLLSQVDTLKKSLPASAIEALSDSATSLGNVAEELVQNDETDTPPFTERMAYGSRGDAVRDLQLYLQKNDYLTSGTIGVYDYNTVVAVRRFQLAHGLPAVGSVGPQTLAKLGELRIRPGPKFCFPGMTPWVKVISPNGGETFTAGQQVTVRWSSCGFLPTDIGGLSIRSLDGQQYPFTLNNTINDGQELITIPTVPSNGEYDFIIKFNGVAFAAADSARITISNIISNYPAGCTSNLGFSVTTGIPCSSNVFPPGCTSANGYSMTTGQSCNWTSHPVGWCSTIYGYSETTGIRCDSSIDTTPRIAYWWGKVNQHVDAQGNWQTDPDGTSGANLDQFTYCKKWYPNTSTTAVYKTETIPTWRAAGNTGQYTNTVTTVQCVQ